MYTPSTPLSDAEKRPYIDEAKKICEQHMLDHSGYRYRPRRKPKNAFKKAGSYSLPNISMGTASGTTYALTLNCHPSRRKSCMQPLPVYDMYLW